MMSYLWPAVTATATPKGGVAWQAVTIGCCQKSEWQCNGSNGSSTREPRANPIKKRQHSPIGNPNQTQPLHIKSALAFRQATR